MSAWSGSSAEPAGGWDPVDDGVEKVLDPHAGLGRDAQHVLRWGSEHLFHLRRVAIGIGRGKIELVQDGHDLEIVLERKVGVCQGLGFYPLGCIDDEHNALARGERAADLVAEVDVARGVDQIDDVVLPLQLDALELDGDPTLPLEVHRIEILRPHLAGLDRTTEFQHAIGQRRLAMVDVGDDRNVSDLGWVDLCHNTKLPGSGRVPGSADSHVDSAIICRSEVRQQIEQGSYRGQHQEPNQAQSAEREASRAQPVGSVRIADPAKGGRNGSWHRR